jgi:hypothetical protein
MLVLFDEQDILIAGHREDHAHLRDRSEQVALDNLAVGQLDVLLFYMQPGGAMQQGPG